MHISHHITTKEAHIWAFTLTLFANFHIKQNYKIRQRIFSHSHYMNNNNNMRWHRVGEWVSTMPSYDSTSLTIMHYNLFIFDVVSAPAFDHHRKWIQHTHTQTHYYCLCMIMMIIMLKFPHQQFHSVWPWPSMKASMTRPAARAV